MTSNEGVTHRKVQDIFILELPRRLDIATGAEANRWVEWGLADSPGAVIVDFARTAEVVPGGLAWFKFLFDRAAEVDIEVGLAALGPELRRQVDAEESASRARFFGSVDDALAAM